MLLPFFNKYPYTNFEQLNLDWMMEKIGNFDARITDNTQKITVLRADLTTETNARITADDNLQSAINTERSERIAADDSLRALITAETNARIAADEAETQARTSADTTLQSNINTEAAARAAADAALQLNIDAEATARAAADTALTNLINGKFSIVEVESDQGVWSVTSDNWADIFDLTKNVLLHYAFAGIYLLRSEYEVHGSVISATFSALNIGVEDVSIIVDDETFNFTDLEYVGGNQFTITSTDGGESITSITFGNHHVHDVLSLICEDRMAIDEVKPVVIEVTASGTLLDPHTTYSTSFDDWSSLMDATDIVVAVTDTSDYTIKAHATNVSPEVVQFILLDDNGVKYTMNIEIDVTPVIISVWEQKPVYHNDIWVSYDNSTQTWSVTEGDTTLISDEDIRTVVIDNDDPAHVKQYVVTKVTNNASNTGPKVYFANYYCEIDSVTNKAKLVYAQFIFEWNPNTSDYDITYESFDIGSAT